jgi:opacity protein-like surface antigen
MKKSIALILMILMASVVYAGDVARKGTTGADQLLIPVGARGIATGGAFVASISGIESIYYNPAGVAVGQKSEAMFNFMNYIADINVSYFAAVANLGDLGSLGLSFKTFDFGDIPVTTVNAPDGTGSTYSPSFMVGGLTYSKIITDRVSVGVNLKVISETIEDASATGFALDFGVQYSFGNNLHLGATVMNIGSNMEYSGNSLTRSTNIPNSTTGARTGVFEVDTEPFQIPSYFELSLAYQYDVNDLNTLNFATTFRNNNVLEDNLNLGLEYGFMNNFFIRGGYNLAVENQDDQVFGFTVGAGVDYPLSNDIALAFDYAYRDVKEFPTENHIFTIKMSMY